MRDASLIRAGESAPALPFRLVDALALDRESARASAFLDVHALAAHATDDDVLYSAVRDHAPPTASVRRPPGRWRFDRVTWRGPDLVTGELKRSLGHWNPTTQAEVFHCTGGVVVLLAAGPAPGADVSVVVCGPGTVVALDGGAWHSSHVVTEEATLDNTYVDGLDPARREHRPPTEKYGTFPPLGVTVVRSGAMAVDLVNIGASPRRCAVRPGWPAAVLGVERLIDIAGSRSLLRNFEANLRSVHPESSPAHQVGVRLDPRSRVTLSIPELAGPPIRRR